MRDSISTAALCERPPRSRPIVASISVDAALPTLQCMSLGLASRPSTRACIAVVGVSFTAASRATDLFAGRSAAARLDTVISRARTASSDADAFGSRSVAVRSLTNLLRVPQRSRVVLHRTMASAAAAARGSPRAGSGGSKTAETAVTAKAKPVVEVDIVSDVMCPWCVVGARYLDTAIEAVKDRCRVRVRWHPFLLSPHTPDEGMAIDDYFRMNYGAPMKDNPHLTRMRGALADAGKKIGIEFKWADRVYSTITAHRFLEWVAEKDTETVDDGAAPFVNLQHQASKGVLDQHFCECTNTEDLDVLCGVATAIGLDAEECRKHLEETEEKGTEKVRALDEMVKRRGIHGVPSWTIKLAGRTGGVRFSGAQPADALQELLEDLADEAERASG